MLWCKEINGFCQLTQSLSFQFLCTSSIPLRTSAFRRPRSIQQKLWELLYFRLSLTLLARQSKINAFIPLWNNRWWKCDEKLSQGERGRPLTMEERAGASSKCHEVQFSYVMVQFSKVQIHLTFQGQQYCGRLAVHFPRLAERDIYLSFDRYFNKITPAHQIKLSHIFIFYFIHMYFFRF